MASTKISDLTASSALAATDRIPVVQTVGAGPVRTTPDAIKTYIETGGTVTASDPVLDLSQTWNNAGVTFTGLKLNVTNTASASNSLFADWQVGGSSVLSLTIRDPSVASSPNFFSPGITTFRGASSGQTLQGIRVAGYGETRGIVIGTVSSFGEQTIQMNNLASFGWTSSNNEFQDVKDTTLRRDSEGVLALRTGVSTQTFRIYNTYTDASNYERLSLIPGAASNWMQIKAETAGTGGDNLNIALTPSGTGGISAHVPDSIAAGGNARGANSVDWQSFRGAASNVASAQYSTIVGGISNTSSGTYSVSGGAVNVASGSASVAFGSENTASGAASWVVGGQQATTRGLYAAGAYASGQRSAVGDAQVMLMVLRGTTTDATPKVLTADAGAASTANQMVLPNNSSLMFEIDVISHDSALKSASWKIQGTARRGANAAATSIVGANVTTAFGSDLSGGSPGVTVTADTTNGAIAVTFTGIAATTIYTVAHVRIVQAA